ncbi:hypothetical protein BSL78_11166 [Apostichopus japonicus]|uniref:Cadherin domain-containing protein n=1 Tax=Stichopus japonicus TaxID=307972 RepID=A0A2G8KVA8_STIJA|nr:hypothetical protein BSL78_11166 [Apostichopus japonicus]
MAAINHNQKSSKLLNCTQSRIFIIAFFLRMEMNFMFSDLSLAHLTFYLLISRYQLDGEVGNKFTIHPLTGEIVTAGRLDREEQSSYQLVVTVTDTGEITASATVFVTVTDINDNQPQFEIPSYLVTIPENAMAGTLVTVTRAVDLDEGLNAENYYSIESGDTSLFAIDHTSGTVTVSQNLSDQTGEFIIQVGVSSGPGSEVMYDLTTVHVTFQFTVQANYPSFSVSGRTQISLVENQPPGEIQIINANSPKVGTSGDITFHFAGGNEANFFSLNSQTGNLATQLTLDHEVQQSFHLWIEARDGDTPPLSSFIDIIIDVVDQNDNAPVFEEESYHSNVTEGGSSGQEVIQVTAVDLDSGSNSRIRYSLSTHADAFNIDIDSGTITTRREFDREMISRYELVVEAEDYGSPAQATSVVVTIDVDDVNDNPMYTTENFEGIVEENVAPEQ